MTALRVRPDLAYLVEAALELLVQTNRERTGHVRQCNTTRRPAHSARRPVWSGVRRLGGGLRQVQIEQFRQQLIVRE